MPRKKSDPTPKLETPAGPVQNVTPLYKAGRISAAEAAELTKHYNAETAKGTDPYGAVVKVAKKGRRRIEILAGSLLCPWAKGMVSPKPAPGKAAASPKSRAKKEVLVPEKAPEAALLFPVQFVGETPLPLPTLPEAPKTPQEVVFKALYDLSCALDTFKKILTGVQDTNLQEYARTGAYLLLSLSPIPSQAPAPIPFPVS